MQEFQNDLGFYIQHIHIDQVRHLKNIDIPVIDIQSDTSLKHLILTGKNGSGKTSLLLAIRNYLNSIPAQCLIKFDIWKAQIENNAHSIASGEDEEHKLLNANQSLSKWLEIYSVSQLRLTIPASDDVIQAFQAGEFILACFEAKRSTTPSIPSGVKKIEIQPTYTLEDSASDLFLQFLVNLKAERAFARDENEQHESIARIDRWFETFERLLQKIFQDDALKLRFDNSKFEFYIDLPNREPFGFNTLADGYSSVLKIVTEILLRMEGKRSQIYDIPGIVLIDEIETHLHLDLQKIVLPFLVEFFPKIQFVVTTHSPFVLTSIPNATIYDLENQMQVSDLTGYTYDAVVESYFRQDKYSDNLKRNVNRLLELRKKEKLTFEEEAEKDKLTGFLEGASRFMAPELQSLLQQIKLEDMNDSCG